MLDRFWVRMLAHYGHAWRAEHGLVPDGERAAVWSDAMAGLSGQQIANGIRAATMRLSDFPPRAAKFRELCLGIPSLGEVIAELANTNAERSPFATAVWRRLDDWAYRCADTRKADAMMAKAYAHVRKRVLLGDALPKPEPQVEHKPEPFTPAQPHVVDRAFAEIMQTLGVPSGLQGADHGSP